MTILALIASLLFLAGQVLGLEVSPNSPCAKLCMDKHDNDSRMQNSSLTSNDMLSCFDWEYRGNNATDAGKKFSDCNQCLQSSGHEDASSNEKDTEWFMFNNRATVDWCLFGRFAEENDTHVATTYPYQQCNAKCKPLYASVDYEIKRNPGAYAYCEHDGKNFTLDAEQCTSCLYAASGLTILGNILTTVSEMCQSKPDKVLKLSFDADIYNASRVEVQSTTSATSSPSSSPPASDGASETSTPSQDSFFFSEHGIKKGVIAGVVFGVLGGIALILSGILLFLGHLKRKNKNMHTDSESETSKIHAGSHVYNSVSQQKDAQ